MRDQYPNGRQSNPHWRSMVPAPIERFVAHGTDGLTNLGKLRLATLNVCGICFVISTASLFTMRMFQADYVHAMIDLVAVIVVVAALLLARWRKFNLAVLLLSAAPPLLAFAVVQMGTYQAVHMVPQIGLCMVTSLLIFDRLAFRIIHIVACLTMMLIAGYSAQTPILQLSIFFGQLLTFALIFLCYVYFFERQDAELQKTIQEKNAVNASLNERVEELLVFSHIMSHDLKGPLTTITACSELLETELGTRELEKQPVDVVAAISTAAVNMNTLINQLLMHARVSLADDEAAAVDLNNVWEAAQRLLSFQIQEQNVEISSKSLPTVVGNGELYQTVFYNVLNNAIKFQPPDRPNHRPRIRVWSERNGPFDDVLVEDNGIGIDPEFLPQMFAPFKRFESGEYEGSGLGMSICRNIMVKFGGNIELESASESGTTFRLTFPRETQPESTSPIPADAAPQASSYGGT